jgi:hypothetical protein
MEPFPEGIQYDHFYGGNLVEIYSGITAWAEKQLNLSFDAFWAPAGTAAVNLCPFRGCHRNRGHKHGRRMLSFLLRSRCLSRR